jgi:altronate dehydratase small subunit
MAEIEASSSRHGDVAATDARLLLLDRRDNVLVATARIAAGETIAIEGGRIVVGAALPLGHKLARHAIAPGDRIVKYGAPIGSAVAAIARGEHVHVHNVKSDYTPTYHLGDAERASEGQA